MNGLISRADAVKEFIKLFGCIQDVSDIDEWVDICQTTVCEVPSAEADWIPCSERLPSEDGEYLVQMSWWGFQMDVYSWADGWNCYRINGKVSRLSEIDGRDIVAWMPLPKPYREDGE